MTFPTPVQVAASSTYVVSYLAPRGRYAFTSKGFATALVVSPLIAPAGPHPHPHPGTVLDRSGVEQPRPVRLAWS